MARWSPTCGNPQCDGSCLNMACRPPSRDEVVAPIGAITPYSRDGQFGSVGFDIGDGGKYGQHPCTVRRYLGNSSITGNVHAELRFGAEQVNSDVADEFAEWLAVEVHGLHQDALRKLQALQPRVAIVASPPKPRSRWIAAWMAFRMWSRA